MGEMPVKEERGGNSRQQVEPLGDDTGSGLVKGKGRGKIQ